LVCLRQHHNDWHKKAPSVGQKYKFTISSGKMIWIGTEGQGTITYQKQ
jgi:hypothetical protein